MDSEDMNGGSSEQANVPVTKSQKPWGEENVQ
jgi:hypothetical protein